MSLHTETYGAVKVISLGGKLNGSTTAEIENQIYAIAQDNRYLLLDLSNVTYLSSAGIRMLLLLYRRIRENRGYMALTGLSEDVRDIMGITGFLDLFTVYEDRTRGLEALRKV